MEDPPINQLLPPMIRLPQVSPHQRKTTLRHFASPAQSSWSSTTWPVPFSRTSPAPAEQDKAPVPFENGANDIYLTSDRRSKRIPRALRRKFSLREVLLGCTILLATVIIVLVLIYYLTLLQ